MIRKFLATALVIIGASVCPSHAATLYGDASSNDNIYLIDTVADTVTLVGSDTRGQAPELQLDPIGNRLILSRPSNNPMFFIDPATGLNTGSLSLTGYPLDSSSGQTNTVTAMEMVGSTLFASFQQAGPEAPGGVFGTINLTTGQITAIGNLGTAHPTGGLADVAGTMYGVTSTDSGNSVLFTVDLGTGAATTVAPVTLGGNPVNTMTGLAYEDGLMYAIRNGDTNLYSLNLTTGALTADFNMGLNISGLASSTVPEPSTGLLLGLCGAGWLARRKRPATLG